MGKPADGKITYCLCPPVSRPFAYRAFMKTSAIKQKARAVFQFLPDKGLGPGTDTAGSIGVHCLAKHGLGLDEYSG